MELLIATEYPPGTRLYFGRCPFTQTGLYQPCVKVIGIIAPKRKQTAIICFILYSECKGMKIF